MIQVKFGKRLTPKDLWFVYEGKKLPIPYRYDIKVDFKNKVFYKQEHYGVDTEQEYLDLDLPTINELYEKGEVTVGMPYKEYYIHVGYKRLTENDIADIIKEFRENGFKVSRRQILHNYEAWLCDLKSGCRGKSTHLFTPCGHNPLSFRASTLSKRCVDWQTTYEA